MTFGDRFCLRIKGRIGGGGWVHLKGADSMAISGLCFKNTFGWLWVDHCSPPMHKWVEKTFLFPCMAPIFGREFFIPVGVNGCQLRTVTIASLLISGCGLSHKRVEDGYRSTQNWE